MTGGLNISREEAVTELKRMGLDPKWRAEVCVRQKEGEPIDQEMVSFANRANQLLSVVFSTEKNI